MIMNSVAISGRLVKDIELKYTQSQKEMTAFAIAIDKRMTKEQKEQAKANGKETCDFIDCQAWNQNAKFLNQYAKKGDVIGIEGRIEKNSYQTANGEKRYIVQVVVDKVEILHKQENKQTAQSSIDEVIYDDMPF